MHNIDVLFALSNHQRDAKPIVQALLQRYHSSFCEHTVRITKPKAHASNILLMHMRF
jgi:hypothetical protein